MIWTYVLSLIWSTSALGHPVEWDRAWALREQVGLAPRDLAAMAVPASVHDPLVTSIQEHFASPTGADNASVDAIDDAGIEVSTAASWGRDPGEAWADLDSARDELIETTGALIDESQNALPQELRMYVDRAVANLGLHSPYRLLDLAADQREAIQALQRQRDLVLRDARQRVRPTRLEAARQAFETQAQLLLTPFQQNELAQLQANIAANLEAVLDRELADYPEDPTAEGESDQGGSLNEDAGQAKAVPLWRDSPLAPFMANVKERFQALLEKLTPAPQAAAPIVRAR